MLNIGRDQIVLRSISLLQRHCLYNVIVFRINKKENADIWWAIKKRFAIYSIDPLPILF